MGKAETILTGLRANDELHLGNYIGGIQPMVRLQKQLKPDDKFYMFVPDLHTFTVPIDHKGLYDAAIQNIRMYLAGGIDPEQPNTILYRQSPISAHAELNWILSCFTYYGELSRMTEFKDKAERMGHKQVTAGLFNYPVLMAADILLYDAQYVPLGDDQRQHVELTRTIAERFNNQFGDTFTVPATWDKQVEFAQRDLSVRILSLSNPEKKMSKSVEDTKGTIQLTDKPDLAAQKVMGATTDSLGKVNLDFEKQPGISNLLQIGALLANDKLKNYAAKHAGEKSYDKLKQEVAGLVKNFLVEYQKRLSKISDSDVEAVLEKGETRAREVASKKLEQVQRAVGLRK